MDPAAASRPRPTTANTFHHPEKLLRDDEGDEDDEVRRAG